MQANELRLYLENCTQEPERQATGGDELGFQHNPKQNQALPRTKSSRSSPWALLKRRRQHGGGSERTKRVTM